MNVSEGDQPERVNAVFMTASMWDVLDVSPALGRAFTAEHDIPNGDPVVVLSHELWTRSFASDPGIIGRAIEELKLPESATIGGIVRGEKLLIAHHDVVIEPEDHLIVFLTDKNRLPELTALFHAGATWL